MVLKKSHYIMFSYDANCDPFFHYKHGRISFQHMRNY